MPGQNLHLFLNEAIRFLEKKWFQNISNTLTRRYPKNIFNAMVRRTRTP